MLVSWNWLKDYVKLDMDSTEVEHRLAMSGLNHEQTTAVGDDLVIDLEVTSNRPDCLGHIGVAREIAVLYDRGLCLPEIQLPESSTPVSQATRVSVECPDLCPRYTARVIRGVQVKSSPPWLVERLQALGIGAINNIVDVTNYVLMECGQPLHAFDLDRLHGPEIVVRRPRQGEKFEAINHREYEFQPDMCVIADADRAVALGGVMGGADSEVDKSASNLLIEAAEFTQLPIRTTARALKLHSDSSYRFERGVDPRGVDWASRRCCQLILELAGGELLEGVIDVGEPPGERSPVTLRLSQLPRILGIEVDRDEVLRILTSLGCESLSSDEQRLELRPPSWRRDLTREVDLVEEVARIHGYEQIPEDVGVPMAPSHRADEDRVLEKVRSTLTAGGFDEAMTTSVVPESWAQAFSPWTDKPAPRCHAPMLEGAAHLRLSLIPSLLESRRFNEARGNSRVELFETARVYLPSSAGRPSEQWTLAVCSGRDFLSVKGVVEALVESLCPQLSVDALDTAQSLLEPNQSCELRLDGQRLGFLGQLSAQGQEQFALRSPATVAEIALEPLAQRAELIPQQRRISDLPSIARDMNLIVDESLRWSDLRSTVRQAAGRSLEAIQYLETYRDPQRDGPAKKRLLLSMTLRSDERTMTNEEADGIRDRVEEACLASHGAVLVRS